MNSALQSIKHFLSSTLFLLSTFLRNNYLSILVAEILNRSANILHLHFQMAADRKREVFSESLQVRLV